jgi:hypothetical protein
MAVKDHLHSSSDAQQVVAGTTSSYMHLYIYLSGYRNKHIVETLQSHMILTMSHWSSGLTCLLPATRVTGSNPLGGLM